MIQFSQEQLTALDQLIKKNLAFVIYKMPHQVTWHFIMQADNPGRRVYRFV